MTVSLTHIPLEAKDQLSTLLFEYQKELLKIADPGVYPYLDSYFEKRNRFPYFIFADNNLAGFALVNNYTLVLESGWSIAEFYIHPKFRHKGIGTKVVGKLINLHPGQWEVRVMKRNLSGLLFWDQTLKKLTNHHFNQVTDNEKWDGTIFTFNNV